MDRSSLSASPNTSKFNEAQPVPAELDRLLKAEALALPKTVRENWRRRLENLRRQLEQTACSASWIDHCWEAGGAFPPAAENTPMRQCGCERCRRCGRLWPAHYMAPTRANGSAEFISYECWIESLSDREWSQLPSSPSGLALRAVRMAHLAVRRERTRSIRDSCFSGSPKKSRPLPAKSRKKKELSSCNSRKMRCLRATDSKIAQ